MAVGLSLTLSVGASAQSEATGEDVVIPKLEGLAWYRSLDLSGPEIESTREPEEVAQWSAMLENAGASFDQLEYTYDAAFDPATLPQIGGLATFRIEGVDTDVVREAVVTDIVSQFTGAEGGAPQTSDEVVGGKDVVVIDLPEGTGMENAYVYTAGDTAYVFLMVEDLAALGLAQLR